jgi:glycosyltransferase involved in cell wall biosynthesis
MKNVLMIAYEFPPLNFSGTARPFGFARYLPEFGYRPTVLTRRGISDRSADEEMLSAVENICDIVRVPPGDNDDWSGWLKHKLRFFDMPFQVLGMGKHRFTDGIAWRLPDLLPGLHEHIQWSLPAFRAGKKLLKQNHFDLIWVTGPPWFGMYAGYWLSRLSGLPLVADIRDPWTYGVYCRSSSPRVTGWHRKWERKIFCQADRIVVTSPLTREIYRQKYAGNIASKIVAITNGYEEFDGPPLRDVPEEKCLFCYVGNLAYCRNPSILIEGLKRASDSIGSDAFALQFIGDLSLYKTIKDTSGIYHTPPVTQNQSRQYMRGADVLVLLQVDMKDGADVISGKAYEYLAAGKPILGVVPENGGDAWLVNETNAGTITGTTDPEKISLAMIHFWQLWKENKLTSPVTPEMIARFNRRNLTSELAELFDNVLLEQGAAREPR